MVWLIQERILRMQWAHTVNISWTTETSVLFPQDVMSCATWHLYRLQHVRLGKGGAGADNEVCLPKGRGSRRLMRGGSASTYSFPPVGGKCTAPLQSMWKSAVAPPCTAHSTGTNKLQKAFCCLRSYAGAAVPGRAYFYTPSMKQSNAVLACVTLLLKNP